jgi:hypothetical protein
MFLMTSIVSAAPNKWLDKTYDFTTVKTVLIMQPNIAKEVKDEFALQKVEEMLRPEIEKVQITPVYFEVLLQQMSKDLNIDLNVLYKQDPQKCLTIVKDNASHYVDAVLYVDVHQMGWTKQYVQPQFSSYTKYETSYVKTANGTAATVQSPQQKNVTIPGGYRDFGSASFGARLFNAKTDKLIWGYTDAKSQQKGLFNKVEPEKFIKQLIEKAFEDIPLTKVPEKQK